MSQELTPYSSSSIVPSSLEGGTPIDGLLAELGYGERSLLFQDVTLAKIPLEQRADILDAYSVEPIEFGKVVNKTLPVLGAAIFEFGSHADKDGVWHPPYYQSRILVEDRGELFAVKSSGSLLLRHVMYLCQKHGWYLFEYPIEYTFTHKGAGHPHYMERVDKQLRKGKR